MRRQTSMNGPSQDSLRMYVLSDVSGDDEPGGLLFSSYTISLLYVAAGCQQPILYY